MIRREKATRISGSRRRTGSGEDGTRRFQKGKMAHFTKIRARRRVGQNNRRRIEGCYRKLQEEIDPGIAFQDSRMFLRPLAFLHKLAKLTRMFPIQSARDCFFKGSLFGIGDGHSNVSSGLQESPMTAHR